jgi:Nucleoside-diphosphate-sugar epimerases
MSRLRVLLTGAAGRIGSTLRPAFADRYDAVWLDREPIEGEPDALTMDLSDLGALEAAMRGVDVVVHLAAQPNEAPFNEVLVPNNVVGLYNTFEAAKRAGVRRVVFASTVQSVARYPHDVRVEVDMPHRPNTLYGATKAFGEIVGRWYHDTHGMEFVGVRIGWFIKYDEDLLRERAAASNIWLSPNDAIQMFTKATEAPGVGYVVVSATSRPLREYLSLTTAREVLGYDPIDNAADYLEAEAPADAH